ncbi:hypothetical protein GIB67_024160 [Kingdonia uniflora]|uniref:Uncharacterized protein n=1 Tax=Kingdonia uniflora TaxID=39325 RepID=A0A7J7LZE2_9MAGN|nr:hypothetical protein GIB67_024160 [Kingdonia uniflora]
MLPPLRSMSSSLNPMEQSPIPSPIHVGGSHKHFDTSGGGYVVRKNSTKFISHFGNLCENIFLHIIQVGQPFLISLKIPFGRRYATNMYFLKQQKENL